MKLRQARKILRRKRRVRFKTALAAVEMLNRRSNRWAGQGFQNNPRPSFSAKDLLLNLPEVFDETR